MEIRREELHSYGKKQQLQNGVEVLLDRQEGILSLVCQNRLEKDDKIFMVAERVDLSLDSAQAVDSEVKAFDIGLEVFLGLFSEPSSEIKQICAFESSESLDLGNDLADIDERDLEGAVGDNQFELRVGGLDAPEHIQLFIKRTSGVYEVFLQPRTADGLQNLSVVLETDDSQ